MIDWEIQQIGGDEIAGAYRGICALMISRSIMALGHRHRRIRKQECQQRLSAKRWLEGEQGVITFAAACEALDLSPDRLLKMMKKDAFLTEVSAITTERPLKNHVIFGKRSHGSSRKDQDADRVVASVPASHGTGGCCPGS